MPRTKVLLVCPGLGHIARGFETFTRECYDALRADAQLDVYLFKGAGPAAERESALWCLHRDQNAARWLGAAVHRDGYYVEQTTFALSLILPVTAIRPEVVYLSDGVVGNFLWRWRGLTGAKYKLLLCNGGQLGPLDFPRYDHVHQGLAAGYEESLKAGRSAETQTLLPQGFRIPSDFQRPQRSHRAALRAQLGLPDSRAAVLTIGVVNRSIKRIDFLIQEVASLPRPRPLLVILGQSDPETSGVLNLAHQTLGPGGFVWRTVPGAVVPEYCDACDAFALASPQEGFGRVLVEALARGLPCIAPDRPYARQVLGEYGYYGELDRPGGLAKPIAEALSGGDGPVLAAARHAAAYDHYSWDRLRPRYVEMIERCACGTSRSIRHR